MPHARPELPRHAFVAVVAPPAQHSSSPRMPSTGAALRSSLTLVGKDRVALDLIPA
eukprot:COSAG02_NODE_32606_length_513_cov_1.541063_2_plen_55_part_01